ncbi:MAG: hypothetical protein N2053_07745 [Chitinispirillaceae bacterium]|nr:hypothetical protein [Chitinispirillaceae bacterium]
MKNLKKLYLVVLILSVTVESAIDPKDSLIVRTILDKIGWTAVPVESVVKLGVIPITSSTVSDVRRVTILDLSSRENLPKIEALPSEISRLPELNTIILKGHILKELPSNFSTLYKLTEVDLSYNQFSVFPTSLKGLGLRILNFSHNLLETLPEWIDTLKDLQSVSFSNNRIKVIPTTIVNLNKLNSLNLDSNLISSLPPSIIETDIKISIHGNRLCNVDSIIVSWLDLHSIKANWLASQICNDKYFVTSVITDVATGTVVHISTEEVKSSNCKPIEISKADISSLPWFSHQKIVKAVEIKFNSCFSSVGTYFLITFTIDESLAVAGSSTLFSIYYVNSNYEVKYLGGNISSANKTISVTANMEGKYLLVMDEVRTNTKNIERCKKFYPEVKIISNKNSLEIIFPHPISSPVEIGIFLLNGRCVYKRICNDVTRSNIIRISRKEIFYVVPMILEIRGRGIILRETLGWAN